MRARRRGGGGGSDPPIDGGDAGLGRGQGAKQVKGGEEGGYR